ncbi:MAG: hypothetical protein F9K44_13775 [Hyphomicrobiaceae bacterium]|nr:MAG: hypothetical protein F9K44_13775 [Hyphomicrobiaceae bacterium]
MRVNQRPESILAGLAGRAYGPSALSALDTSAKSMEPSVKSVTRANLELTQFWARRARATLETPHRLSRCRTPQQCMHEAIRLAHEAADDVRRTGETVLRLWTMALQQPSPLLYAWMAAGQSLTPQAGRTAEAPRAVQRDVITFPERSGRTLKDR